MRRNARPPSAVHYLMVETPHTSQAQATPLKTILEQYPDRVTRQPCPNIEHVCDHSFWFYQSMLLASREDLDDIVAAIKKIHAAFRG